MTTNPLTTNYQTTAFTEMHPYLNAEKVVGAVGSNVGNRKNAMFSARLARPTTYYLLYKEKEKRGVRGVAGRRLVLKVVGSFRPTIEPKGARPHA